MNKTTQNGYFDIDSVVLFYYNIIVTMFFSRNLTKDRGVLTAGGRPEFFIRKAQCCTGSLFRYSLHSPL